MLNSKWHILESREVFAALPWLRVAVQRVRLPDGQIIDDYYQVWFPDSVVVAAYTDAGRIVMCREYRHGFARVSLMLPTGAINEGESPLSAAKRELVEETGYVSDNWRHLRSNAHNANYGCGMVHLFLATNAVWAREPSPCDLEVGDVVLLDKQELTQAIRKNDIYSADIVGALTLVEIFLSSSGKGFQT